MTESPTAVGLLDTTDDRLLASALGWKVTSWRRALREALHHLPPRLEGRVLLELGAGVNSLSLFFSRLGCRVVCADRRLDYTREAITLHRKHGVLCHHLLTDARRLALRPRSVDVVVMKSVLGGIYSQAGRDGAVAALAGIREVLRPGGLFIALEQLEGGVITRLARRARYPTRRWHYFRVEEFAPDSPESLMAGFDVVKVKAVTLLSPNMEEWLPHKHPVVRAATLVDQLFEPLVPANWKHMVAIVATLPAETSAERSQAPDLEALRTLVAALLYAHSTTTAIP